MYAIVDIAGFQYKVEKDKKYYVSQLQEKEGQSVEFDKVLLLDDNGKVKVGTPNVKDAKVSAKVLSHVKDDKKIVYKKKRRKRYQVKNGHRQPLTQIQIEKIETKKAEPKKAAAKAEPKKTETKTSETKKTETKKTETKKTPGKSTTTKKTQSKQAQTKKTESKKTDNKNTEDKKS